MAARSAGGWWRMCSRSGGCLTMEDMAAAVPTWHDPLVASYRGLDVHTLPPPCEGFQCLLTLRILDGFDLGAMERDGVEHLDTVWRAIRLAAGVRIAQNKPRPAKLARILSEDWWRLCARGCATPPGGRR